MLVEFILICNFISDLNERNFTAVMKNLTLQFYTVAEREPKDGEQVLFKAEYKEKKETTRWQLGRFEQFSGYGAVFATATAYFSKDDVTEYAVLPESDI